MKKTQSSKVHNNLEDIRSEYKFDYGKARPNRFAKRKEQEPIIVMLDPDISQVFTTSESVNTVLRAILMAMPSRPLKTTR